MELAIIFLIPEAFIIGLQFNEREENFDYDELNLFFGIVQLQFRF